MRCSWRLGSEQQPIGAGLAERHPDAAGIHHPNRPDHPIELHVRVPAHHDVGPGRLEKWGQALLGRQPREDGSVTLWRGMAEQHAPKGFGLDRQRCRPLADQRQCLSVQLAGHPAHRGQIEFREPPTTASPAASARVSRSPLPRMNRVGRSSARRQASDSAHIGPGQTSPPTTTRSTPTRRTSSSTASSAGRLPWMS